MAEDRLDGRRTSNLSLEKALTVGLRMKGGEKENGWGDGGCKKGEKVVCFD